MFFDFFTFLTFLTDDDDDDDDDDDADDSMARADHNGLLTSMSFASRALDQNECNRSSEILFILTSTSNGQKKNWRAFPLVRKG